MKLPQKAAGGAPMAALSLLLSCLAHGGAAIAAPSEADPEAEFLAENQRVMAAMHAGMMIQPSGDVDADFAAMMIPHHQGAIDMAVLELRYGSNEQLRRIAQEIIVEQQQEIAAMRLALGQAPTRSASPGPCPHEPEPGGC